MQCKECGANADGTSKFCNYCGAVLPPQQAGNRPPQPYRVPHNHSQYLSPGMTVSHEPGSYASRLHSYGRSPMFLVGMLLFIIGNVAGALLNFSIFNIFSLGLIALPVIGLILAYTASTNPCLPEKTLTALTLFKVSTIIELVLYCLLMAAVVIIAILVIVISAVAHDPAIVAITFVSVAFIVGIMVLFLIVYYVPLLCLIAGIKRGLISNVFEPLKGVTRVLVALIVLCVFMVISNAIAFAGSAIIDTLLLDAAIMAPEFADILKSLSMITDVGTITMTLIFSLMRSAGAITCVLVVRQFNKSITGDGWHSAGVPPLPPGQW